MLSRLQIENLAVIEKSTIEFDSGLNVLTGETGAGKSIIIDSINAVLGERTSRELVRTGAAKALVAAYFTDIGAKAREKLDELGYECEEDGSLLLSRNISVDGKGGFYIGGRQATASILREVGKYLINIHGQQDSQLLMSPENHINYLDLFAKTDKLLAEYSEIYNRMLQVKKEIRSLKMDEGEKARKLDLLSYQINEIESANIRPSEYDELMSARSVCINYEKIRENYIEAMQALESEDNRGALDLLYTVSQSVANIADYYPEFKSVADRIEAISIELEECRREIRALDELADFDPKELDSIESRLDTINRLMRKYGGTEEEILSFLDNAKDELEKIEFSDSRLEQLEDEYNELSEKAMQKAAELTLARQKAGAELSKKICSELEFLSMPSVVFEVLISPQEISYNGCDKVEFLISANPGEPPKPLNKIASGGELSRIMLAIKRVLSDMDEVDSLIFDEIDSGISGRAAVKVGRKLKEVSRYKQVICVTHLAQIASRADTHLLIEKTVEDQRTHTRVTTLNQKQRINELARIIGGDTLSETVLKTASEMLEKNEDGEDSGE